MHSLRCRRDVLLRERSDEPSRTTQPKMKREIGKRARRTGKDRRLSLLVVEADEVLIAATGASVDKRQTYIVHSLVTGTLLKGD